MIGSCKSCIMTTIIIMTIIITIIIIIIIIILITLTIAIAIFITLRSVSSENVFLHFFYFLFLLERLNFAIVFSFLFFRPFHTLGCVFSTKIQIHDGAQSSSVLASFFYLNVRISPKFFSPTISRLRTWFQDPKPESTRFRVFFFFFFLLEHENYTPIFFYFRPFHGPGMWFHDPKLNSRCQNLSVSNENATFFWLGGANFELVFLFSTISRPQDMISGPKTQIEDNSQSFRVSGKNAFSLFFLPKHANFAPAFLFLTISTSQEVISGPKIHIQDSARSLSVSCENAFSIVFFSISQIPPQFFFSDHFTASGHDFRTHYYYHDHYHYYYCNHGHHHYH